MENSYAFRAGPVSQVMSTLESDDATEYSHQYDSGICSFRSDFYSFGGPSKHHDATETLEEQMRKLGFGDNVTKLDSAANSCTSVYSGNFYASVPSVVVKETESCPRELERIQMLDETPKWIREEPAVDIFQQDEDGDTKLHLAIIKPDTSLAIHLIEIGQFSDRLDIQNDHQQTPLHLAVITDQPHLVRALVLSGASQMTRDKHGNTPLHLACKLGHAHCVERLTAPPSNEEGNYVSGERQKRGLSAQTTNFGRSTISCHISLLNYEGDTCLHLAMSSAAETRTSILNYLLFACGADVNSQEGKCGFSLLHQAVRSRDTETVRFLLDQPGILINQCCYNGYTPLDFATSLHQTQLAQVLRSYGAASFANNSGSESNEQSQDEDFDDLVIAGGCFQR